MGDLVSGVLTYGTIEADDASKKQTSEGEASKKKGGKLSAFLKDLAPFLGVPHDKAKPILTSYLAGKKIQNLNHVFFCLKSWTFLNSSAVKSLNISAFD